MARKKKDQPQSRRSFSGNPFNDLKGFSVSASQEQKNATPAPPTRMEKKAPPERSFAEEMEMLKVQPVFAPDDDDSGMEESSAAVTEPAADAERDLSPEEMFLAAVGEMEVRFAEPDYADEAPEQKQPQPRRMKLLRQGKIVPDATLDLHGLIRSEVPEKLQHFIQNARHHGWKTLLVITGKGLHSEAGEAVLRQETERFIKGAGNADIAEWGWAPKKFGGEGAIVLFLKNRL